MPCDAVDTVSGHEDAFTCTNCGDCCHGYGGTYVTDQDIETIAAHLNMPADRFRTTCCRSSGRRLLLSQADDGYCLFWKRGCAIHAVKPQMCRDWPFIKNLLKEPQNWEIMAGVCPGMRPGLDVGIIQALVRQVLAMP